MRTPLLPLVLVAVGCSNDIQVAGAQNQPPAAAIQSPAPGSSLLTTDLVDFVGLVSDSNGLEDIVTAFWNSSVDGELADIDSASPDASGLIRLSTFLSPGQHAITLTATDAAGAVGEDTLEVTVSEAWQAPDVAIDAPVEFQEVYPMETVDLLGSVDDLQQGPETLLVEWEISDNTTGEVLETLLAPASTSGTTAATWVALDQGIYVIDLTATDDDGNATNVNVAVIVQDPSALDQDGDGYSVDGGDCDDGDALVYPGADEICGDAVDNDCNLIVDDKDDDMDGHVDIACVNYTGFDPVDDCDDTDPSTYPGAYEQTDGVDNDCDGAIDNGGVVYDDDGDCYCEVGPCTGSVEPACLAYLADGDCDDDNVLVRPGTQDDPDLAFEDLNCDGVDGDAFRSIFLDPVGGSDANTGLGTNDALLSLSAAYQEAAASGRNWILIADGSLPFSGNGDAFDEGIHLAGGYDASTGWARTFSLPEINVAASGARLDGWTQSTEWQQIRILSANAIGSGASSTVLWLDNSVGLLLVETEIIAGNGVAGLAGADGTDGGDGTDGANGDNGCANTLGGCLSVPSAGSGGASCSGSGTGGGGGVSGLGLGTGGSGSTGGGSLAGAGGNGGTTQVAGAAGDIGGTGPEGTPGLPGGAVGTFSTTLGYLPDDGTNGGAGFVGSGGGGGGGGGGAQQLLWPNYGGAGGGGGGSACGGTRGYYGHGGGGSFGIILTGASIVDILGGSIDSGFGGSGGAGGTGGDGGQGGAGGSGGGPDQAVSPPHSGSGGDGGDGGDGGRGGHGGGGGGGPSVGLACVDGTATFTGTAFSQAGAGVGGGGAGSPGANGLEVATDGC